MRQFRLLAGALACFTLLAPTARAEAPRSPLRLIPAQADLLLQVKQPRRLAETITRLEALAQLRQFPNVKEFFDSTPARRFRQMLAYFEKEMGQRWPEMLDQVAGGGIALGVKFGSNPGPALLVIQGRDEKAVQKFARLTLTVLEQDRARDEGKIEPTKRTYQDIETLSFGKDFHAAVAGSAILLSNNEKALHRALDLHLGREKKSLAGVAAVADADRLLPKQTLASLWLNMETVRKGPQAKELYKTPRNDPFATVVLGSLLDVLGRTPYVCAGLYRDQDAFIATVRIPRGREGMGAEGPLHMPPVGQPGSRPLLQPRNVLLSESFYLDVSRIWEDRTKLFNDKQVKALEKADQGTRRFPLNVKLSKLLTTAGPYHRFVAVDQPKVSYKVTPKIVIPAFAYVLEMRDPQEFGKTMAGLLRSAALFASFQVKLKTVEEKRGGSTIVGYRFREDAPFKGDANGIRFSFSPCFAQVGNQFVFCSTLELGREVVDLLEKEDHSPSAGQPNTGMTRLYASGAASLLKTYQDQLLVQTVLSQAVEPKEAETQVKAFIAFVKQLGTLSLEGRYEQKLFRFDVRLGK